MSKVDLYVFSGTGNTLTAAKFIRETFQSNSIPCSLRQIKADTSVQVDDNERIIGIGFPIACYCTYPVVLDFIERLPEAAHNSGLFFFSTMAASDGNVCAQLAPKFIAKGYTILGYEGFVMPSNFMQFREHTAKNQKLIAKCKKDATAFIQGVVLSGKPFTYSGKLSSKLSGLLYKLSFSSGFMNLFFKVKVDPERCTGCGICSKSCPIECISITGGKAKISSGCQECMRCVGFCPEGALKVNKSLPYSGCSYTDFFSAFDQ